MLGRSAAEWAAVASIHYHGAPNALQPDVCGDSTCLRGDWSILHVHKWWVGLAWLGWVGLGWVGLGWLVCGGFVCYMGHYQYGM